jgi:hypothetical protein
MGMALCAASLLDLAFCTGTGAEHRRSALPVSFCQAIFGPMMWQLPPFGVTLMRAPAPITAAPSMSA